MKKIPTLFKRVYTDGRVTGITDEVNPGLEWVLAGEGLATVKNDGTCCAVIGGKFYKRYDAKKGKTPPPGAIPCSDPDPVTCHWPHWLPVDPNDPGSNWHLAAYYNSGGTALRDGTYEAVGPHFQSNPYALNYDFLEKHGKRIVKDAPRDFEGLREYLGTHNFEGLVFWKDGEPRCKIKRSDYGFKWPDKTLRVEF